MARAWHHRRPLTGGFRTPRWGARSTSAARGPTVPASQYDNRTNWSRPVDLRTTTALVTGANRGFGRALAAELVSRGATVLAGARRPGTVDLPGVTPLALDITDPASIAAAAAATGDVSLLVN